MDGYKIVTVVYCAANICICLFTSSRSCWKTRFETWPCFRHQIRSDILKPNLLGLRDGTILYQEIEVIAILYNTQAQGPFFFRHMADFLAISDFTVPKT
jgi:hypothetical protein